MKFPVLYDFIHSLNEKEVVDVFFKESGYNNQSKYFLLYDFLATYHGEFQPDLFEAFLSSEGIKAATSRIYSNRIYEQIMDVLLSQKAHEDYLFTVQKHLAQAKILWKKEQLDLALFELKRAKDIEKNYNFPSARFEIEMMEARILFQKNEKDVSKPLAKHHKEAQKAVDTFVRDAQIQITYQAVFNYQLRAKNVDDEWQALATDFSKIPFPENSNLETLLYFCSVKMKIAYWQKATDQILYWTEKVYRLFQDNQAYQQIHPLAYLFAVDNYLIGLSHARDFSKFQEILDELEKLSLSQPSLITRRETTIIFHTLTLLCNDKSGLRSLDDEEIERLKIRFEKCKKGSLRSRERVIDLLFGVLYLFRFDYENAEEYFGRIKAHRTEKLRSDIQRVKLLIEILINLNDKLQATKFIDSKIDKAYERLSEWQGLFPHESTIIKNFRRWNKLPLKSKRELQPFFEEFHQELSTTAEATGFLPLAAEIISSWLVEKIHDFNPR